MRLTLKPKNELTSNYIIPMSSVCDGPYCCSVKFIEKKYCPHKLTDKKHIVLINPHCRDHDVLHPEQHRSYIMGLCCATNSVNVSCLGFHSSCSFFFWGGGGWGGSLLYTIISTPSPSKFQLFLLQSFHFRHLYHKCHFPVMCFLSGMVHLEVSLCGRQDITL